MIFFFFFFKASCELHMIISVRHSSSVLCLAWCPLSGPWCHTSFQDRLAFKNTLKMIWSLYLLKHCINEPIMLSACLLFVCASCVLWIILIKRTFCDLGDKKRIVLLPALQYHIAEISLSTQYSVGGGGLFTSVAAVMSITGSHDSPKTCSYCRCIGCASNWYTKMTETF